MALWCALNEVFTELKIVSIKTRTNTSKIHKFSGKPAFFTSYASNLDNNHKTSTFADIGKITIFQTKTL